MNISEEKAKGRFYTPAHIVRSILDLSGYKGGAVLRKHAADNSCGDGAFLEEMVERYCRAASDAGYTARRTADELGRYIHGIELDPEERDKAVRRATAAAARHGAGDVVWDIRQGNTLAEHRYDGRMDFVLGNPPYVRVHHLAESHDAVKRFRFTRSGMTDLFLVFYEIGLAMLKPGGTLGYITPSSLFNSRAAGELRRHFIEKNLVRAVVNLKHYQPFEAATYTTIMVLSKDAAPAPADYFEYDPARKETRRISRLEPNDFYLGGNFYFGTKPALARLAEILGTDTRGARLDVKNGFATLLDSFFIGDLPFGPHVIPVVKASTGGRTKCLYPYDRAGRLLPYGELARDEALGAYYRAHEARLRARSLTDPGQWYGFGRTQGIADVYKEKYSVSPIIKDAGGLKITRCGEGTGVYGGLYVLTGRGGPFLRERLLTEEFMEYVTLLGKYKSGGYYTFSSKDLKRFLVSRMAETRGRSRDCPGHENV